MAYISADFRRDGRRDDTAYYEDAAYTYDGQTDAPTAAMMIYSRPHFAAIYGFTDYRAVDA